MNRLKQEEMREKGYKGLDLLYRKYQVDMNKIQEQEERMRKMNQDGQKREEHLKKRKEHWEDKLKRKKEEVIIIVNESDRKST